MTFLRSMLTTILLLALPAVAPAGTLTWPIGCIPGIDCLPNNTFSIGYPDIDGDGKAFDCGPPGYVGHTGTDISVGSVEDAVPVLAADDGEVLWVSGGKYDHCPNEHESDCNAELQRVVGIQGRGAICNYVAPSCATEECCLAWGFNAGNFILLSHDRNPDAAMTLYAHLRKGSIIVANGQRVKRGEKIAEVGSSGASLVPHLHFGVWSNRQGHFELADPWAGKCGPNVSTPLWKFTPPYRASIDIAKTGSGTGIVVSSADGLNCGSTCSRMIQPGTSLTLRATPYSGSEFAGWEGACAGKGSTCTLTAEGAVATTAIFRDTSAPQVRALAIPTYTATLAVPVTSFTASDNVGVTGYLITETPAPPLPTMANWSPTPPPRYLCSSPGDKTLYAWAKDAAGNISAPMKTSTSCGAIAAATPGSRPAPADQPLHPVTPRSGGGGT